jgi:hypothetical protein
MFELIFQEYGYDGLEYWSDSNGYVWDEWQIAAALGFGFGSRVIQKGGRAVIEITAEELNCLS